MQSHENTQNSFFPDFGLIFVTRLGGVQAEFCKKCNICMKSPISSG